ncbi:hypothetical protein Ahy_A03g013730 isoform B [Arachis hypogaea]|uniref:Transposase MuDR plant domain-containing protein n=1 Tax=Arachis hypogaea TaxID=3818 RepID=A0A445DW43_ARAHY|nr:hypothetical protein Ahy_A03g013730 isoform B [Arachis hypogaea]
MPTSASPSPSPSDVTLQTECDVTAMNGSGSDLFTTIGSVNHDSIFTGFDDFGGDFYLPEMPSYDYEEENLDGLIIDDTFFNSEYVVVCMYLNCRMRNSVNEVIFECENPSLLCTRRVSLLSELKSLILSNLGGLGRKEIGRVGNKLLAPLDNGVFQFCLFRLQGDKHLQLIFDIHGRIMVEQVMELSAKVGDVGGGGSVHSTFVQDDDPPLTPPPIHVASPVEDMDVGDEESDEEYIADSSDSDFSEDDEGEDHYHTLDLDVMHEKYPFFNTGKEDYNQDGGVKFGVGHRFKSRDAVMQGMKNYSIRRSVEYRMVESDRLKYHVHCRQSTIGCLLSLCVALRQNLGYCYFPY